MHYLKRLREHIGLCVRLGEWGQLAQDLVELTIVVIATLMLIGIAYALLRLFVGFVWLAWRLI